MEVNILDDLWTDLRRGFEQIFTGEEISKQRFMQLYTNVYNYCESVVIDESILGNLSVAQFVGGQLYIRVDLFLNGVVKKIAEKAKTISTEEILNYYSNQWATFQSSAKHLNQICSFLNKNWIKKEVEEHRLEAVDVYELALTKWRKVIFEALKVKVTTACLGVIEKSRNGDLAVDLGLVKTALASYVELGRTLPPRQHASSLPPKPRLTLYETAFESQYLYETENYFRQQAVAILNSEKDFVEILTVAEDKLDEERRRARTYLQGGTEEQLKRCGEKVLLNGHEKFRTKSFAE